MQRLPTHSTHLGLHHQETTVLVHHGLRSLQDLCGNCFKLLIHCEGIKEQNKYYSNWSILLLFCLVTYLSIFLPVYMSVLRILHRISYNLSQIHH